MALRYAHMSSGGFLKWLQETPENIAEARSSAYAYLSLREEGRTQISIEQLFHRINMCERVVSSWPAIVAGRHYQIALPADVQAQPTTTNPLASGEIVQVFVNNARRLGLRQDAPQPSTSSVPPGLDHIKISPWVQSDDPLDWQILKTLSNTAPDKKVLPPSSPSAATNSGMMKVTWDLGFEVWGRLVAEAPHRIAMATELHLRVGRAMLSLLDVSRGSPLLT